MKLIYVTLTGADNTIKPTQLADISKKYRYVEWAILFSQNNTGSPRYPTMDWIDQLVEVRKIIPDMNLSAHLCGKWVDDVLAGKFTFLDNKNWASAFDRIQLNTGKERLHQAVNNDKFLHTVRNVVDKYQIILGGDYKHVNVSGDYFWDNMIFPLFDASGGRGIETKLWPKPFKGRNGITMLHGYAGGLGPDNVAVELNNIAKVVKDTNVWIDMETSLRDLKNYDKFDLECCEKILQITKSWT